VRALRGKRALVLEDEPVIGFALEDMLEALGCKVAGVAHQIVPALELIELREFDFAVLDVNVQGELSYGVADALAERGVPYVFATGHGEALHPKPHLHAPTISKPYTIDDLRAALARYF